MRYETIITNITLVRDTENGDFLLKASGTICVQLPNQLGKALICNVAASLESEQRLVQSKMDRLAYALEPKPVTLETTIAEQEKYGRNHE